MRKALFGNKKRLGICLTILCLMASFLAAVQVLAGTVTYTYDELDRLIQEVYEDGTTINYAYDDVGNRLSKEVVGAGTGITLISPNGGERWQPGTTEAIFWTYKEGAGPSVKIELFKGGALNSTISAGTPIGSGGSGFFDWPIPSEQTPGSDFQIKISNISNGAVSDLSRSNFTIEASSSLSIKNPVAGANWARGTTQVIGWTYTGDPGSTVLIELLKGGVFQTVVATAPIGSKGKGSHSWDIPANISPGADYQIRISTPLAEYATTSKAFSILGGITVTTPNGGEQWQPGTTYAISWDYAGNPGSIVKIELLKAGVFKKTIAAVTATGIGGKGTYNWTIPADEDSGTDYRVRITSTSDKNYSDSSDSDFTLRGTSITVATPNGGEQWQTGTNCEIRWSYTGNPGSWVEIELLKADTVPKTIAGSAPAGNNGIGSYIWAVPSNQEAGTDYKIRITSTANGIFADASDNAFTVLASSITVTPPDIQPWTAGKTYQILWKYVGDVGPLVKIELLKGGVLYSGIADSVPVGNNGNGMHLWKIPIDFIGGSDYKLRITSTTDGRYTDSSDENITIVPWNINVTSPNGLEVLQPGVVCKISWTYKGDIGPAVKIELLKGASVHSTIVSWTSIGSGGNGSFTWNIPANQSPGYDFKIRITSLTSGSSVDESDNPFTIASTLLTITSPNGGEKWKVGTKQTINWKYTGNPGGTVKIELLKGPAVDSVISSGTSIGSNGLGSYSWNIPYSKAGGSDYWVRVTSTTNGIYTDTSDDHFAIIPSSITVTAPDGDEWWLAGTKQTISWKYTGNPGSMVKIELLKGTAVDSVINAGSPIGSGGLGSYSWDISPNQSEGWNYRVRVTSTTNGIYTDTSDYDFTIKPSSLWVTTPNGGEWWQAGAKQTISWKYTGNPGSMVKIELLKGTAVDSILSAGTPIGSSGLGSYSWDVPSNQSEGRDYQIRVSTTNGIYTDTSDNFFNIKPISITVSSPSYGGENWQAGSTQWIWWNYSGNPGSMVKIELLKGGEFQYTIAGSVPLGSCCSGYYYWSIPAKLAGGSDYSIRVTSTSNSTYTDSSDKGFTITPTNIWLTAPYENQQWKAGSTQIISWGYSGQPGSSLTIELRKKGLIDRVITSTAPIGYSNKGSFYWTIPADLAPGANYRIRVISNDDHAYTDITNGNFTILPP
jgi:YD repeat-containing protein